MKEIKYLSAADNSMQPAMFSSPGSSAKRPLLVGLHTWSQDYTQYPAEHGGGAMAAEKGWVFIYPNFRGHNDHPEATGSDLVIADIASAVDYARTNAAVDESRIYLLGCSGGGYTALLMAGRMPQLWTAVSVWVPISDLKQWYVENKTSGKGYDASIAASCCGDPTTDPVAAAQAIKRSPLTYLNQAKGLPLDIHGGLLDDVVPFTHSLRAFNAVAEPEDRIPEKDIEGCLADRDVFVEVAKDRKFLKSIALDLSKTSGRPPAAAQARTTSLVKSWGMSMASIRTLSPGLTAQE